MNDLEYAVQQLKPPDWDVHYHTFDGKAVWILDTLTHRGYIAAAQHDCGAIAEMLITFSEAVRMRKDELAQAVRTRLFSCYCVRPDVIIPCTDQRCAGAP